MSKVSTEHWFCAIMSIICITLSVVLGSSIFLGVAFVFLSGFFEKSLIWPLLDLWIIVGKVLHLLIGQLLIGILFFGIVAPLALLSRLLGPSRLASGKFDRVTDPRSVENNFKDLY